MALSVQPPGAAVITLKSTIFLLDIFLLEINNATGGKVVFFQQKIANVLCYIEIDGFSQIHWIFYESSCLQNKNQIYLAFD